MTTAERIKTEALQKIRRCARELAGEKCYQTNIFWKTADEALREAKKVDLAAGQAEIKELNHKRKTA